MFVTLLPQGWIFLNLGDEVKRVHDCLQKQKVVSSNQVELLTYKKNPVLFFKRVYPLSCTDAARCDKCSEISCRARISYEAAVKLVV